MRTQTDLFWKAGVLTLLIFVSGVFIGYWLDSSRVEAIREEYQLMEIGSNDARMQSLYYQTFRNTSNFCEPAIKHNLEFAEFIYSEGAKLEEYEKANRLSPSLVTDKRRYVLLQLQFWLNSIELKTVCNASYVNLVYFYSHYNNTIQEQVQGDALLELKKNCGRNLMLIPLPVDLNITTVDMLTEQYNITNTPTILVDEEIKLEGLQSMGDLREHVSC